MESREFIQVSLGNVAERERERERERTNFYCDPRSTAETWYIYSKNFLLISDFP